MAKMLAVIVLLGLFIQAFSVPLPDGPSAMDRIWQANQERKGIANDGSKIQVIEMDIVNTPRVQAEIKALREGVIHDALTYPQSKWPNAVVPYVIVRGVNAQFIQAVQSAIAEYTAKTCIRFVPRTNQANYVSFFSGGGCYSYIGRTGGKQDISLGPGCEYKGIAIHEMMHALGFFHEQSRRDRDSYIKILFQNIVSGMSYNFDMYQAGEADTLGESYDKKSVMHYGNYAFSSNGQRTIVSLADPNESLGQRDGLSDIDVRQLLKHYQCATVPVTVPATTPTTTRPPTTKPTTKPAVIITGAPCADNYPFCEALDKYCTHDWVKTNCQDSCNLCVDACVDVNQYCSYWTSYCTNARYKDFMKENCRKTCAVC